MKYVVGFMIIDPSVPCIIVDGDSVLCTFPALPYGQAQAEAICNLLNAAQFTLPGEKEA